MCPSFYFSSQCNYSFIGIDEAEGSLVFVATSTDAVVFSIRSFTGAGTYTVEVNHFVDDQAIQGVQSL